MLRLKNSFLHPLIFNELRSGKKFRGVVKAKDCTLTSGYIVEMYNEAGICIETYTVSESTSKLHDGLELKIGLSGDGFVTAFTLEECETKRLEEQKREAERKRLLDLKMKKLKEDELRYMQECKDFYETSRESSVI